MFLSCFSACFNTCKPATGAISHAATWLVSGTRDLKYIRKRSEFKSSPDEEIAIYCVHGTADRRSSFSKLISRMLPSLPSQVTSINLVSFEKRAQGKDIKCFAEQLKNKVALGKHKNVIVMGHSRGGLVASYFAENLAKEIGVNILQVVCISSPLGGSHLAVFPFSYFSSSVSQMKIDSVFLDGLSKQIKKSSARYIYFAAEKDNLVSVDKTYVQESDKQQRLIILDNHGHLSIMTSVRLAAHINETIIEAARGISKPDSYSYGTF